MVDELPGDNCLVKLALVGGTRPVKSPRIIEGSVERWPKIARPSERKIHYAPRERKRYFDVIQRYFAAIQFQSSKASETNGPIFERQRNYKRLSVTRLFLSYPSPLLSPSFHLFLGVTLVIETLHSKEILASFRRNEVKKREATLFEVPKLGELGRRRSSTV